MASSAFHDKLANGGSLVVAEGYIYELERRGYIQLGMFVPSVLLKHPEVVKTLHEEFVHAGSDVIVAVTYYGHRQKLRAAGLEDRLEELNRKALSVAREVARATGTLFAGNICNSTVYQRDKEEIVREVEAMFKEQVEFAVSEGVDFILAETFNEFGEAMLALNAIKSYAKGTPAVVNLTLGTNDNTFDGVPIPEACRRLEEAGADVVGLNCGRGPATILPLMKEIRKACKGPIACLPIAQRTTQEQPALKSLRDPNTGERSFPSMLVHACSIGDIREFAEGCKEIGVQFVGLCCGNCSVYTRTVAEVYGRTPPSSDYSGEVVKRDLNAHDADLLKWKGGSQ